jgi:phosphoserine aminotransferase
VISPSIVLQADKVSKRVSNFNAGPGALPLPVIERIREELLDWRGSGMSVMEMSHRSPEFESGYGVCWGFPMSMR